MDHVFTVYACAWPKRTLTRCTGLAPAAASSGSGHPGVATALGCVCAGWYRRSGSPLWFERRGLGLAPPPGQLLLTCTSCWCQIKASHTSPYLVQVTPRRNPRSVPPRWRDPPMIPLTPYLAPDETELWWVGDKICCPCCHYTSLLAWLCLSVKTASTWSLDFAPQLIYNVVLESHSDVVR